jgi:RNA-directed DNA polymerase
MFDSEGTPQGGPLSPLLSNIVLDEFDRELEQRGLRFARYADDSNIYVRSKRARERVMESVTRFIMAKLKLRVNEQKSAVARPWARKFLGFSFTNAGVPKRRIAPKAVDRFKEKIRELTRRNKGVSIERMAEKLTPVSAGVDRLLREMPDTIGAGRSGSVDQAQTEVCDLAAVAIRIDKVCETPSAGRG